MIARAGWLRRPRVVWILGLVWCLLSTYAQLMKPSRDRDQPWIWGWDNNHYFAWGRSLVVDGDADFANDFAFVAGLRGGGSTREDFAAYLKTDPRTPIGRVPNKYGIGFGLLAVPALAIARALASLYEGATGIQLSPFAAVYALAFTWTSVLVSFAGLALLFRIMSRRLGEKAAMRATLAGLFGLSTGYYVFFDPTMAHAVVFGLSAFFIAAMLWWERQLEAAAADAHRMPARHLAGAALLMGLILGFCCAVRYTAIAFAVAPISIAVAQLLAVAPGHRKRLIGLVVRSVGLFMVGTALGFMPQMVAWRSVYGSWFLNTYAAEESFWWPRNAFYVLFAARAGLFVWTPLALVAVAGLVLAARQGDCLALSGIATLLAALWIYGSWGDYALGHSYGMRGFVDVSLFLLLGLGAFFEWISGIGDVRLRRVASVCIGVLLLWNINLVVCYQADIQPHGEPLSPARLFSDPHEWLKQFKRDINLPKRLRSAEFPLFTPMNVSEPEQER